MGKIGRDWYGEELLLKMNQERVQTRGVRFVGEGDGMRTGCSYMRVKEICDGRMGMEVVKDCPEDSLQSSELNLGVLKEVSGKRRFISVFWSACLELTLVAGPSRVRSH